MYVLCLPLWKYSREEALMLAGKNRGELEAVLEYYREDSLKTKAAEFLIGNMPGHYSFADTVSVNRYYDAVDAVLDSFVGPPDGGSERCS